MTPIRLATFALLLAVSACGGSTQTTETQTGGTSAVNIPYSQTDLAPGSGRTVASGNRITVNYHLWLYDPAAADHKGRSIDQGQFPFQVGTGNVIPGFDKGVTGMAVGGKRRLIVPPEMGYGSTPSGPIPANSTLIFEVEVVSIDG